MRWETGMNGCNGSEKGMEMIGESDIFSNIETSLIAVLRGLNGKKK
jgi:hypothetical protein